LWLRLRRDPLYHFSWSGLFGADRHELVSVQFLMFRRLLPFIFLLLWMFLPQLVSAQEATPTPGELTPASDGTNLPVTGTPAGLAFLSPENGASLSGSVEITANVLSAWALDFSYAADQTGAWFPLAQSIDPASTGTLLTTWDTTALTDGFYVLRLRIFAVDGGVADQVRVNVRIRNYSMLETSTPTQILTPTLTSTPMPQAQATVTSTFTPAPSPTLRGPLQPNPAELSPQEIFLYLGKGSLAVVVVFGFSGLIWALRRRSL